MTGRQFLHTEGLPQPPWFVAEMSGFGIEVPHQNVQVQNLNLFQT